MRNWIVSKILTKFNKSLISNNGSLVSEGGFITLSAATANSLSTGAINLGPSSELISTSYNSQTGRVQIGGFSNNYVETSGKIDVSSKDFNGSSGNISIKGKIYTKEQPLMLMESMAERLRYYPRILGTWKAEAKVQKDNGSLIVMSENVCFLLTKTLLMFLGLKKAGIFSRLPKTITWHQVNTLQHPVLDRVGKLI